MILFSCDPNDQDVIDYIDSIFDYSDKRRQQR